jgi:hypothetical protein
MAPPLTGISKVKKVKLVPQLNYRITTKYDGMEVEHHAHWVEVSEQIHAPAALPLGKRHRYPWWAHAAVMMVLWRMQNPSRLLRMEPTDISGVDMQPRR